MQQTLSINHWQGVLFDLDGCLIDTAPDMGGALNRALIERGHAPLSPDTIRPHVSYGAKALVKLGFGEALSPEQEAELVASFLAHYAKHIADESRVFAGLEVLLEHCEAQGVKWGIVTNKPTDLTQALLSTMRPQIKPGVVVCGDTLSVRKPDPEPVLLAASTLKLTPNQCVYLGDAQRDIQAGNGAGMSTLATAYGYVLSGDNPRNWGASAVVTAPEQVLTWLAQNHPEQL